MFGVFFFFKKKSIYDWNRVMHFSCEALNIIFTSPRLVFQTTGLERPCLDWKQKGSYNWGYQFAREFKENKTKEQLFPTDKLTKGNTYQTNPWSQRSFASGSLDSPFGSPAWGSPFCSVFTRSYMSRSNASSLCRFFCHYDLFISVLLCLCSGEGKPALLWSKKIGGYSAMKGYG